jgi:hypothetical protein
VQPSPSRVQAPRRQRFATVGVERITAASGFALIIAAAAANQSWLDRHFLPSFFLPRHWYVLIETIVRGAITAAGASLVLGRSRVATLLTRAPTMSLQVVLAAVLAIASSELVLRWILPQPTEWLVRDEEPRRQHDPQLGWVLAPARTGHGTVAGRSLEYAVDATGYRVRRVAEPVDAQRPTIVFAGESVMFGEGLAWEESIPAQVSAMVGIQSANLAVHGYSTDQIYLRLVRELPRFQQPVAVVSIFMAELFGRNLDDDRPYLGPGLVWHAAEHKSRLMSLAGLLVPYRRDETVERGVRVTREVFLATTELARRHAAKPLVIVPEFGVEDDVQRALRERILGSDIPTVRVRLDSNWRLAWDRHPNADAARVIASAVAERLQPR